MGWHHTKWWFFSANSTSQLVETTHYLQWISVRIVHVYEWCKWVVHRHSCPQEGSQPEWIGDTHSKHLWTHNRVTLATGLFSAFYSFATMKLLGLHIKPWQNEDTIHCGSNIVPCNAARPWRNVLTLLRSAWTQEMFWNIQKHFLCAWQYESTFGKHDLVSNVATTICVLVLPAP